MSNGSGNGNGQNGNGHDYVAANDYRYDVFLSYSFKNAVKDWVANKFYPNFIEPFDNELIQCNLYPPAARVYLAERENKPGDVWPDKLIETLTRSKVLLAVCSPHYFESRWCKSEWETFRNRAPQLIIPVLYYGNDNYLLPRVDPIQYSDFRNFRELPGGRMATFRNALANLAATVAGKVAAAPPFSPSFPHISMPASQTQNVNLQTLERT